MKLGIMQPYFLPYLGYFSLIKCTDQWVVFDTVQYINKGWINRNRILSPSKEGISYMTVPVIKKSREMLIKDALIDDSKNWREKIIGQINYYKKKAPFFNDTKNIIEEFFDYDSEFISELNVFGLELICSYLNIPFKYQVFSHDIMGINSVESPDEWALEISKKKGADVYINPPGGKAFFNKDKYDKVGIKLKFHNFQFTQYNTFSEGFQPGLSIVDVMMFNSPEKINAMLEKYELE